MVEPVPSGLIPHEYNLADWVRGILDLLIPANATLIHAGEEVDAWLCSLVHIAILNDILSVVKEARAVPPRMARSMVRETVQPERENADGEDPSRSADASHDEEAGPAPKRMICAGLGLLEDNTSRFLFNDEELLLTVTSDQECRSGLLLDLVDTRAGGASRGGVPKRSNPYALDTRCEHRELRVRSPKTWTRYQDRFGQIALEVSKVAMDWLTDRVGQVCRQRLNATIVTIRRILESELGETAEKVLLWAVDDTRGVYVLDPRQADAMKRHICGHTADRDMSAPLAMAYAMETLLDLAQTLVAKETLEAGEGKGDRRNALLKVAPYRQAEFPFLQAERYLLGVEHVETYPLLNVPGRVRVVATYPFKLSTHVFAVLSRDDFRERIQLLMMEHEVPPPIELLGAVADENRTDGEAASTGQTYLNTVRSVELTPTNGRVVELRSDCLTSFNECLRIRDSLIRADDAETERSIQNILQRLQQTEVAARLEDARRLIHSMALSTQLVEDIRTIEDLL
ncbi:MAG: hypothetical protein WCP21_15980, partial [Armatimonadota bacterium]